MQKNREEIDKNKTKKILKFLLTAILIVIALITAVVVKKRTEKTAIIASKENLRAMTYEQFEDGDENIEGTDNVKFSAFFLRDLDGDGYAEKIKGTCKHIATEQDTLYMDINVLTEGYLKDAKIQIDSKNFYFQTALPKDNELKDDYISSNIKTIEFNNLNNGTQKLITGTVRSGNYTYNSGRKAAIGNNINNYSRDDNTITLTGTYVAENGTETEISKQIVMEIDWYGETGASFNTKYNIQNYYDISNRINEDKRTFTATFDVNTEETKEQLNISKNYVQGTIPELNGYAPISVVLKSGVGAYTYNETTRLFTITKIAETDNTGTVTTSISKSLNNTIEVVYPIEAYTSIGTEMATIKVPVSTYYEGYNNPNDEFDNPYKSNIATATLVVNYMPEKDSNTNFDIKVGKIATIPNWHYMISKRKPLRMYNEISSEESNDTYIVSWNANVGTNDGGKSLVLKETRDNEIQIVDTFIKSDSSEDSMEDITSNVGIYFSNSESMLGTDGEIKVYDEDTGILLHTFTSSDWNIYTASNPYKYDTAIKHIKIVTSNANKDTSLYVYNIKELDDDKIIEVYTREEFDNLQFIKSNLVVYLEDAYVGSKVHQAYYEAPYSLSTISLSKDAISTQNTEKGIDICIQSTADESINQIEWTNGEYLIKLPDEILSLKINSVEIDNTNVSVNSYEYVKNTNGKFIKINTSNIKPESYTITINVDITADPRNISVTRDVILYAKNEGGDNYCYSGEDIYDVDSDGNVEEQVNVRSISINTIAPNSLLTNQTMSEFDESGIVIISPNLAELKPIYGNENQEKQTVKIGAQIKNNYLSTISEILMLGKIPFEGNTYVLSGGNLSSEFSTTMTNAGIIVPIELQDSVTVYYSTNENPSKDINDTNNGWTLAENVTDWSLVKTWLVDFEDTVLEQGAEYVFYYTVEIPFGIDFNKVAYSHHGIYFSLDTEEGKYRTQTEPNKIGVMIADKYNLILTKYQKDNTKLIKGATYRVSKLDGEGNIEESQTAVTNAEGLLEMANLYIENKYEVKEIQSPIDYEINEDVIKIIGHIDRNTGILTVDKEQGTLKNDIQIVKNVGEDYKVIINVEDEAKAKLRITKYEEGTDITLRGVRYRITGYGLPESGKTVTTNINGEISLSGIKIGEEYTLEEVKAEGYYLASQVKIKTENNNGIYEVNVLEGEVKRNTITIEDSLPIVNIELEDEKIPTYDLEITKIKHITKVVEDNEPGVQNPEEVVYLSGAKFKLYKGYKKIGEYITDANGKLTITGLYQYIEEKGLDQIYTLKEILPPDGYAKVKDIVFKVQLNNENKLEFIEMLAEGQTAKEYTSDSAKVNITVEDCPSFKLIKEDGETGELLANTKFAIYNVDSREVPATNSKGEICRYKRDNKWKRILYSNNRCKWRNSIRFTRRNV